MRRLVFGILVLAATVFFTGCSTLPEIGDKNDSQALPPAQSGPLGESAVAIGKQLQDDESAFLMIPAADEAMHWRLAMIDSAVSSIDAQYFIWKGDPSGSLVLKHLMAAADRGVRVRLLVDDMFLSSNNAFQSSDQALAAIDRHPNIELRLFNPGKYRDGIMGLAGNFGGNLKQYNRRMHNKLAVFDGHFSILGGRNIGDEYFGLYEDHNFLDLDVMVAGAVSGQISEAFDAYWNSELSYPGESLVASSAEEMAAMRAENTDFVMEHTEILASYLADPHDWSARIASLETEMVPGFAAFLQDEPINRDGVEYRLYSMLNDIAGGSGEDFIISTPYLIPVGPFLQHLSEDVNEGVKVRILTNSLASNDATAAHSHYKKYRRELLDTGAQLYEFQHQPAEQVRAFADVKPRRANFIGLHMKASSVDGERCFIGSLNMDPRSVEVNTENGLYIESPELCGQLHQFMQLMLEPESAWSVTRDEEGKLQFSSDKGATDRQPAQGAGQRSADFFFRLLPLESQL